MLELSEPGIDIATQGMDIEIGPDGPRYYWGGVGKFFAGPPYVGAVIVFLTIIGFFVRPRAVALSIAALLANLIPLCGVAAVFVLLGHSTLIWH